MNNKDNELKKAVRMNEINTVLSMVRMLPREDSSSELNRRINKVH